MFIVSVPATDRNLLTLAEMKAALGISGSNSDAALTTLGLQISDMIARECCVAADGVTAPTLRRETIIETFRLDRRINPLRLARRFVDSITSIVEAEVTLTGADYEAEKAAGLINRLDASGGVVCWQAAKIVITYLAGFATVPEPLKLAAITVLREQWSAASRDPLLRRERVDGVSEMEFWVNSSSGSATGALSGVAASMLQPYRSVVI
jgi:hypothetical protein